jgi:hypothetical protein
MDQRRPPTARTPTPQEQGTPVRNRPLALAAAVLVGGIGIAACGETARPQPACAAIAKSGGGASKSGGSSAGARSASKPATGSGSQSKSTPAGGKAGGAAPATPKAPTSPAGGVDRSKAPDPPAYPAGGGPRRSESKPPPPRPRDQAKTDRARRAAARPSIRPDPEDYDDARAVAPSRLSRSGRYESPITNTVYMYQPVSYFSRPGYMVDIWNPYDPFNYWYRPWSPFYGRPYVVAGDCDGKDEKTEQPVNVTVNVDSDGKVIGEAPVNPATAGQPTTIPAPAPAAPASSAPNTPTGDS